MRDPGVRMVPSSSPMERTTVSQSPAPEGTCEIDACDEPAVVEHRGAAADELVDASANEIVALCAAHAADEQAAGSAE
jgi:hypothetical protein